MFKIESLSCMVKETKDKTPYMITMRNRMPPGFPKDIEDIIRKLEDSMDDFIRSNPDTWKECFDWRYENK